MNKRFIKKILKVVFLDFLVYGFFYFPIWWYSVGLYKVMLKCLEIITNSWHNLGISIQLQYLFKPMYAQRDFTGIAISFVMRIFLLTFKLISFVLVFIMCMILFILWVALPIITAYGLVSNYKFLAQV